MSQQPSLYRGYRFLPEIIAHTVWLYHRFGLSFRNVEDLLAERGIIVTYETIRQWRLTFGLEYARRLRTQRGRQGGIWYLDEVFVRIRGRHITCGGPWTKTVTYSTSWCNRGAIVGRRSDSSASC